LEGRLKITCENIIVTLDAGQFCLLPASLKEVRIEAQGAVSFMEIQ